MHWAEKLADKIIKRNPDKEEYVCAAGILSLIHIFPTCWEEAYCCRDSEI